MSGFTTLFRPVEKVTRHRPPALADRARLSRRGHALIIGIKTLFPRLSRAANP
jgi:hypothetical protein